MNRIFNSFGKPSALGHSAIDAVLGAAGTRIAIGALRRYPKTALAMAVIAGAGALIGGLRKTAAAPAKPRKAARKSAGRARTAAA